MLYVVAWPLLSGADDTALRRLRAQYHPREAELIGPHFTLVFSAAVSEEARLRRALDGITARPFWFMLLSLTIAGGLAAVMRKAERFAPSAWNAT